MITYQVETVDQVRDEITPMLEAHYLEITTNKAVKQLDCDWDAYNRLEDMGMLRIFTARNHYQPPEMSDGPSGAVESIVEPGKLVGYFITFLNPHLHYRQTLAAMNDVYYVTPQFRKGSMIGYNLMKQATEDLKNLGADILTIHMKTDYPFRNLLIRQGFTLVEENWEKVL